MPYRRKKLTFAISSPDEFLFYFRRKEIVCRESRTVDFHHNKTSSLLFYRINCISNGHATDFGLRQCCIRYLFKNYSKDKRFKIVSSRYFLKILFSERTTLRSLYAIGRPSVVCLSVVCL